MGIGEGGQHQASHRGSGRLGFGRVNRFIDPLMLVDGIPRLLRDARLVDCRPSDRSGNSAGERYQYVIAGCLEQKVVKSAVRKLSGFTGQSIETHVIEGATHGPQLRKGTPTGSESRRRRLDNQPQLEQTLNDALVGISLEHPLQYIGIQQMPAVPRGNACTGLGTTFHQPLGRQNPHGFPVCGARNLEPAARKGLLGKVLPWLVPSTEYFDAQLTRN